MDDVKSAFVVPVLNLKLQHLLSRSQSSNRQHTFLIWLRLTSLPDFLDRPTRISSLCLISDRKWDVPIFFFCMCRTYHLELSSSTYSFLGFIICFQRFAQNLLISKVSSTMSSRILTYALTMDSSLPCISHFASFLQNNMIAWNGRPDVVIWRLIILSILVVCIITQELKQRKVILISIPIPLLVFYVLASYLYIFYELFIEFVNHLFFLCVRILYHCRKFSFTRWIFQTIVVLNNFFLFLNNFLF